MDGVMESWVHRLATALRTHLNDANIVITDWLPLAHQLYPMAVKSTRTVGKDIAHLLQTLKVQRRSPEEHLRCSCPVLRTVPVRLRENRAGNCAVFIVSVLKKLFLKLSSGTCFSFNEKLQNSVV